MKKIFGVTLSLCLAFATTCTAAFHYEGKQLRAESDYGAFVYRYPILTGDTAQEGAIAAKVNGQLRALAQKEGQALSESWNAKTPGFKAKDVDFNVTYLGEKLFSINFTQTFAQGEKEPLLFKDGWTFDLTKGESVSWRDLLRSEDKPKATESALLHQLHKGYKNNEFAIYWGLDSLKGYGKNYYVDSQGAIHLQFNPYEIGPAKSGVIDLDIQCQAALQ